MSLESGERILGFSLVIESGFDQHPARPHGLRVFGNERPLLRERECRCEYENDGECETSKHRLLRTGGRCRSEWSPDHRSRARPASWPGTRRWPPATEPPA